MSDIKSLGYIRIQTSDIDRWRSFAFDVLGFAQGSGPEPDALYLRMDERPARIIVVPGDTDQVVHVGWEVRDGLALQRVRDTLERAGVAVKPLSVEEADDRRVEDVFAFTDPTGTPTEVFFGPALDHSPVVTPFGATFVTGLEASYTFDMMDDGLLHKLKISGNVTNLANVKGVSTAVVTSASGGYQAYPMAPRMFFLTVGAAL